MTKPKDIQEYISGFPEDIQQKLEQIRMTIKRAAPDAEEVISYGMPSFKLNGSLVWFAAFTKHIGFYPAPSGIEVFYNELSVYKSGKGSVHFRLDEPIPFDLITKIVKYRVSENMQKATNKKK
jgi:uncharacterized protein YdhG (YjbR/CyaY superfamily)